uniref:Uncharacterized protein n=1 Tax=Anguilla anguilla TaxID=7936 RepID=A0A0E9WKM1_ANGAN
MSSLTFSSFYTLTGGKGNRDFLSWSRQEVLVLSLLKVCGVPSQIL